MKKQITGDKSIYDIYFIGTKAYLSTGFGIVVLNLEKDEISETYLIGDNGQVAEGKPGHIGWHLPLCSNGSGDQKGFAFRSLPGGLQCLGDAYGYSRILREHLASICYFKSTFSPPAVIRLMQQDQVYYSSGSGWNTYPYFTGNLCHEILNQGDFLTLVDDTAVHLINDDFLVVQQMFSSRPRSASLDNQGDLWLADYGSGIDNQPGRGNLVHYTRRALFHFGI